MSNFIEKLRTNAKISDVDPAGYLLDFHNKYAGITEDLIGHLRTSEGKTSYEILLEAVNKPSGKKIVDLACGSGPLTTICVDAVGKKGKVIGVDVNKKELELAQKKIAAKNVSFLCEPAQDLSLPESSVDAVLCHLAFHLMRPIEPVVREIKRVLKPKGIFSAVLGGIDHEVPIYDALCSLLEEFIKEEISPFLDGGFGDARSTTIDGLQSLFREGFSDSIDKVDFCLNHRGKPEDLIESVIRYFYSAYLLSRKGKRRLREDGLEILKNFRENDGMITFKYSLSRVSIWREGARD